ncbi:hypothetical protein QBC45DRAFT_103323 [Copromyces sp. CBS 386.78]|nr:hypothetical protein QBC45DRAFT_103323 [Copromyces sp. CBS 386.78]
MDFHSQLPDRGPRPTLQVITAYPPQSQTSNYSYPLSGTSPGRESVGSDISSVPSMIEDHGSDISTEDEYQYHHTSRSGGLWNCFWNNTQAEEKDLQTANTPARPISHHAGIISTADSTPERKKSSSRPTLASSRPDSGFAQGDNNQWPLTPPYTSHSHPVPRTFSKPLPTSTYSLFPPTPPSDIQHSSSVPLPPRRSSLARPWTSDTLRLEQTPQQQRAPVGVMCRRTSLGRKRKLGGEQLPVTTVCSPSPRSPTTSTTTASLVFRARPSIIPVPSSTCNLSQQMASAAYNTEPPCLQAPYLTPTDLRRPSLTNLRRNSRGPVFPRPPSSRDHNHQQQTRASQQQQRQQQRRLEERPLPPLPLHQRPQRPPRSSPPSPAVFPAPPTSPLPPLQPSPPPPPPSTLAPAPAPPVVSVFETDSDDEDTDSDSSSDEHNHFGAGGVVESFARRLMRSLLGGHGNHYSHESRNHHQRCASDYTSTCTSTATATATATNPTSRFTKAIHLKRSRSDAGGAAAAAAAAQQLDVIEESGFRYRKSCSNAREDGSSAKQNVLGRRGRLWGRSR